MKIYISVDIEGIAGVVSEEHCSSKGFLYSSARKQMTKEVNAVIEGAIEAGATEFIVNDAHGNHQNIIPDILHEKAQLILGSKKPMAMMQGIDKSFDAAMFVGYHAKSNTAGVLCHSFNSKTVFNVWLNNRPIGETEYNALVAGLFNVPVILVSGDNILCEEASILENNIIAVESKEAMSYKSAKCLHPNKVIRGLKQGSRIAIENFKSHKPKHYTLAGPYSVKIQFKLPYYTNQAKRYPNSVCESPDIISYKATTLNEALGAVSGIINIVN